MIKVLKKENMGVSNLAWLKSRFHFSFAEYRNPKNINFGVLRVLNDDTIHPKSGFDTHPHANMEIISYIVNGEITHKDSMGNSEVLKRGEVQYLSAGDGIYHSEHNFHESEDLRLLQIWIIPPQKSLARLYGSHKFTEDQRNNKLLNIVSSQNGDAPIKIYQDVNIYVSEFDKDFEFDIKKDRQVYFVLIEGNAEVNGETLNFGDAMELVDEDKLKVNPITKSHILFIEMKK
ncbi:pirin family protein [Arcobacter porcinus]|uniref:Pirin family protein n=1 Tax=Arcobacter porcinus TaxID=1935204 RepID=A0A1C0AXA9_9BACT|nr:pirin family protein [Arcobacter porcinus]OCL97249.1 Quercetin 2,3-dioxygenase [Aliarcobacter thereius]OCL84150.1 Quercetin 2,3-dioxygenase [Arcobacter porcinus]OCL84674.1 Quercetin 2,3-dioxygenase [Arcobacter porcinus]OCL89214.1 Quercetin 2,3-dioxygenase [Arcobacter porcinus]OCL91634.1 Quercetin 2,3-dioxygenase [Arcobacter porcinus]